MVEFREFLTCTIPLLFGDMTISPSQEASLARQNTKLFFFFRFIHVYLFLVFIWSKMDPAFFQIIQNIWEQSCVSHKLTRTKALQWLSQTHMIFSNLTQANTCSQPASFVSASQHSRESYSTYLVFMLISVTPFWRAEIGELHLVPKYSQYDSSHSCSCIANICTRPTSN